MLADDRIKALMNEDDLNRIPSMIKKHAKNGICSLIEKTFPDIYEVFNKEEEPDADMKAQMKKIVDDIMAERLQKHSL